MPSAGSGTNYFLRHKRGGVPGYSDYPTEPLAKLEQMPRACPVEFHVGH
jgi:hypothetical protein